MFYVLTSEVYRYERGLTPAEVRAEEASWGAAAAALARLRPRLRRPRRRDCPAAPSHGPRAAAGRAA